MENNEIWEDYTVKVSIIFKKISATSKEHAESIINNSISIDHDLQYRVDDMYAVAEKEKE